MTRNALAIRQGQANNLFQTVWWKPIMAMQRDMARSFTNALAGTPLEGMITAQESLFEKLEDNVSNVFGEIFNNRQMLTPWLIGDHTEPYVDIIENHRAYKLKAELPGVKEQDINVEFVEGGVQIEGEKYEECAEKGENYRHQECHAGYFSRTIALPEDADLENAKTRFNLNILTIEVPKKASAERKLDIRKESSASAKPKAAARPKEKTAKPEAKEEKLVFKKPEQSESKDAAKEQDTEKSEKKDADKKKAA